jgi:AcrR family transcriptional regulator
MGYSQTAAYSYFKKKDEILAEVRAAAMHRFCDRLDAARRHRNARTDAKAVGTADAQPRRRFRNEGLERAAPTSTRRPES